MPPAGTVAAQLAREVAEGRLNLDCAQQEAAARLDRLAAAMTEASGRPAPARTTMMRWLGRRAAAPAPRGLYLWGGVGRGKTLLMDLFYDSLAFAERERVHFYRLMRMVHAELASLKRRSSPVDVVAQRLAGRARVICLDEFFVADIADAMILAALLEGLHRRGVALVATSNRPPRELYKDGLQRARFLPAIDLISRTMEIVHLDGPVDYRLRRLEQSHTYYDSTRPQTTAQMERLFDTLATGSAGGPMPIAIDGRTIGAIRTGPGLAWFEFRELCETARSANDYLELARMYHTIFVAGVPLFTSSSEDAARRFLTLIDALYDRGVKIVVSAAAAPQSLYQGSKLAFAFQRAVSRLTEMQTTHYLAEEHRP